MAIVFVQKFCTISQAMQMVRIVVVKRSQPFLFLFIRPLCHRNGMCLVLAGLRHEDNRGETRLIPFHLSNCQTLVVEGLRKNVIYAVL